VAPASGQLTPRPDFLNRTPRDPDQEHLLGHDPAAAAHAASQGMGALVSRASPDLPSSLRPTQALGSDRLVPVVLADPFDVGIRRSIGARGEPETHVLRQKTLTAAVCPADRTVLVIGHLARDVHGLGHAPTARLGQALLRVLLLRPVVVAEDPALSGVSAYGTKLAI
jgi:hypothetical protein